MLSWNLVIEKTDYKLGLRHEVVSFDLRIWSMAMRFNEICQTSKNILEVAKILNLKVEVQQTLWPRLPRWEKSSLQQHHLQSRLYNSSSSRQFSIQKFIRPWMLEEWLLVESDLLSLFVFQILSISPQSVFGYQSQFISSFRIVCNFVSYFLLLAWSPTLYRYSGTEQSQWHTFVVIRWTLIKVSYIISSYHPYPTATFFILSCANLCQTSHKCYA